MPAGWRVRDLLIPPFWRPSWRRVESPLGAIIGRILAGNLWRGAPGRLTVLRFKCVTVVVLKYLPAPGWCLIPPGRCVLFRSLPEASSHAATPDPASSGPHSSLPREKKCQLVL